MIPKKIHYTWFSGEEFPEHIKKCIKSWYKFLPDYELVLWDMQRLKSTNCQYALEAASVGKWAFASDFVRVYAVYNEGGVYLDTDMELFKSLNPFLENEMFIGGEANFHEVPKKRFLTAHVFGAVKGHPFLKDVLEYYKDRHFILSTSKRLPLPMCYDMTLSPIVMGKIAEALYGYNADGYQDKEQVLGRGIHVYPSDYFDSPRYHSMKRVVSIHRAQGAWRPGNENNITADEATGCKPKGIQYLMKIIFDSFNSFSKKHFHYIIAKA